jgi:23S rRNA (pseudouridine1915-N3)-methyltransferase
MERAARRRSDAMKIRLAAVTKRRGASKLAPAEQLVSEYIQRATRFSAVEETHYTSEQALLKSLERGGRTAPVLVVLDSRGRQMTSEELAELLRRHQERGTQELVLAIGPSDGWSEAAYKQAATTLSLGKITLPHELARVVLAEQIYRALTILHRHPYHLGH